ncbi:hypothetical protein AVEN_237922-1 [Araneus ventricosus]|uniref:Uncharacterized protein n=1 Tax=Araneus ventricosus TaxID=182803 RepID=A0A4Y2FZ22_ARAVE|nr:hypothetical protein AVEN_237922-1 [Araneus ventricosus]
MYLMPELFPRRCDDPKPSSRSRSFVPDEEFYYSRERFSAPTSVVSSLAEHQNTPLAESEPPCSSMRKNMLVYVALSAVNTTSKL